MADERFVIKGRYRGWSIETVDDTAETQEEADRLLVEYQLAFGSDWTLWIEEDTDDND